ncbi:MAG TPA: ATP-binding protein [Prolixibacteraceae bacterium]|nr:ATP-binding protein [Prolixibacteraceae bacterium]
MKFYNREKELDLLKSIKERSEAEAQMTVIVGRRRIGKTSLIKKAIENESSALYLFVTRKSEVFICEEFVDEIEQKLQVKLFGKLTRFKDIFRYLMDLSVTRNFSLVIDEFQEFYNINPSVYSEMQNIWDSYKDRSRINLILCGSIYALMKKIFENSKEPLFGRANERIHLKPFHVDILKEILKDNSPNYKAEDLLAFYVFTGGVAKYIELLISKRAFTLKKMLDEMLRENSLFIDEGRNVLIEEFGKDYSTYFSILSLISSSKTSRSEIESILETSIGGFLERLENDFNLIRKVRPIFSKPGGKNIKYEVVDNFLNFWFRFIYKYQSSVEIGNFDYLRSIVDRDYPTYTGKILERYFKEKLVSLQQFSAIGTWWEKGNQNELDIVAVDELNRKALIAEVKIKKENISLPALQERASKLLQLQLNEYNVNYVGYSMENM